MDEMQQTLMEDYGEGYNDKVYFQPGDKVVLNKLKNAPEMYVARKKTLTIKGEGKVLQGIVCRWFNKQDDLCEEVFSTKDLMKL